MKSQWPMPFKGLAFLLAAATASAQEPLPATSTSGVQIRSAWEGDANRGPRAFRLAALSNANVSSAPEATVIQAEPMPAPIDGVGSPQADGGGQQDNGTNPAQNAKTAIIANEFYHLDGGNEINTVYVRLKFPILEKRGALLIEVPYKWYDLTSPIEGEVGGLGDVKLQLSYNACASDDRQWTFITFLEMFIPSADNILFNFIADSNQFTALDVGSGKYVLGPGAGVVYAPRSNFIIAPLYFYEGSVAGDDNRPDISRGKFRFFMMYAWPSGLYLLPEFQLVTNFKTWNNDAYVAPEVGYSTKGSTFYIKPGLGIAPDTNDRAWGVEFGVRVLF